MANQLFLSIIIKNYECNKHVATNVIKKNTIIPTFRFMEASIITLHKDCLNCPST